MKITRIGSDYITIDEKGLKNESLLDIPRVHLIKLEFADPTEEKINAVFTLFQRTNRFVIDDNIKIYNEVFKKTMKKYYVMNRPGIDIISFFRKNNKVLMNFLNLDMYQRDFLWEHSLEDVLKNVEVIMVDQKMLVERNEFLQLWRGNIIINDLEPDWKR